MRSEKLDVNVRNASHMKRKSIAWATKKKNRKQLTKFESQPFNSSHAPLRICSFSRTSPHGEFALNPVGFIIFRIHASYWLIPASLFVIQLLQHLESRFQPHNCRKKLKRECVFLTEIFSANNNYSQTST